MPVITSHNIVIQLAAVIEGALCHLQGKHSSTKAKLLIEAIVTGNLFQDEAAKMMNEKIIAYICNLFRPWRLVKAADLAAMGAFQSTTINALRNMVDEKPEDLFHSVSTVSHVRRLLDNHGIQLIGWTQVRTKYGAVFYLNFEKALSLLLKAPNLHELATTTSVKIALSVDGADLFKGCTPVSTGVKITDEQAVHQVTKQPFAVCNVDSECIKYIKLQSSDVCCIMMIADAVDSKQLYEDVIKNFYEWGNNLQLNGLPASDLGPKLMPFQVLFTNDLKAAWYL